jgi:hypothetical protein
MDLLALFDEEVKEVRRLLAPGSRRRIEAHAKLRALAIVDGAIHGERTQPSEEDLQVLSTALAKAPDWQEVFRGAASINITASGVGPSLDLRFSKKEGVAIQTVKDGAPDAFVVGIKRVNELDFYSLGRDQVAEKLGISGPKTTALIRHCDLENDLECSKQIRIGKSTFRRYSPSAVSRLQRELQQVSIEEVWANHGCVRRARRR